jgi:hypothetical protein
METRKTKLGADHPSTLTSMANLASTYRNQGRWEEAEELDVQVMETRKTKLGADHPDTLTSMNNLAFTWKKQGRDTEAISLMRECVRLRERKQGTAHPYFISSSSTLVSWEVEQTEARNHPFFRPHISNKPAGAARSAPLSASNAKPATSSAAAPFLVDTRSRWKSAFGLWSGRSGN